MSSQKKRAQSEERSRLTRLAEAMCETMRRHPDRRPVDKTIIFLDSASDDGLLTYGYQDDTDAMAALLSCLTILLKDNGMTLEVFPTHG